MRKRPRRTVIASLSIVWLVRVGPLEAATVDVSGNRTPTVGAPSDSARAVADSSAARVPFTYEPEAASTRPFLRCTPSDPDSLFGLFAIDAFLEPPRGPSRAFDRASLRSGGAAEWWEVLGGQPGLFVLEPGYPGVTSAFSFRDHGAGGTLFALGSQPLVSGLAPIENVNRVSKSSLSGAFVMPVSASHLYGPGAGGGAVLFMPLSQAPDRPFTEVTQLTGIFGQKAGSVTTSVRWGRLGVVLDYAGATARDWTLFGGYRAERGGFHADWIQGGTRLGLAARRGDERLKGFVVPDKRSDDGTEMYVTAERRLGAVALGALRVGYFEDELRADGVLGTTRHEARRTGGDALVRGQLGRDGEIGVVAGLYRIAHDRRETSGVADDQHETTGFALARTRLALAGMSLDGAARFDRTETRENVWAAGLTASRAWRSGRRAWAQVARTTDRPAFFHRTTDFYTQVDQGLDRPRRAGQPVLTGAEASAGVAWILAGLELEVGGSVARGWRRIATVPDPVDGPLGLYEPTATTTRIVRTGAAWGEVSTGARRLGFLGSILLSASGTFASQPEAPAETIEPSRYGRVTARLRHDFFQNHLRLEGELAGIGHGSVSTRFARIPAQGELTARAAARVADIIIFYRSENVLRTDYATAAYDESTLFAPLTGQNITVGLSWVLLD